MGPAMLCSLHITISLIPRLCERFEVISANLEHEALALHGRFHGLNDARNPQELNLESNKTVTRIGFKPLPMASLQSFEVIPLLVNLKHTNALSYTIPTFGIPSPRGGNYDTVTD